MTPERTAQAAGPDPAHRLFGTSSRLVRATLLVAGLAWLYLLGGLAYANFLVAESPPNPVIVFSARGLTSLLVELASLAMGSAGLLLSAVAYVRAARDRALAWGALGNASVCVACVALLM